MRCFICDSGLSPESIRYNHDHKDFEPCPSCLIIISEVFDDHLDEDEVTWLIDQETFEEDQEVEGEGENSS